jgi:hypothetical protein
MSLAIDGQNLVSGVARVAASAASPEKLPFFFVTMRTSRGAAAYS